MANENFRVKNGLSIGNLDIIDSEGNIKLHGSLVSSTGEQYPIVNSVIAGTGISLTGTNDVTITNAAPDQVVVLTGSGSTNVTGTYPNFTISSTDTTYSAGTGISLTGTQFSHADTSTVNSVNNSNNTFIQDLTFDSFGHVTEVVSGTVTIGNGTLTVNTSGNGLSGSGTFTADQSSNSTITITSNATDANTANTIVARDASGNFSAGTITATLSGNAATATKLAASKSISLSGDITGTANFDGSDNVTITVSADGRFVNTSGDAIDGQLTIGAAAAYDTAGELALYGTGKNLAIIQTSDNTQDRGLAFRNSNGNYAAYIGVKNNDGNAVDMVLGVAATVNADVELVDERIRITKGGNVLIGTSTDNGTNKLQVAGATSINGLVTVTGDIDPSANGTYDLGSTTLRWRNIYTSDLNLNNGIGNYTIVEGENDLFLYNNTTGKVYKFVIQEVDPSVVPAKLNKD